MVRQIRDAKLQNLRALPDGAATVDSAGIDLAHSARGDFLVGHDLVIKAPALTVGELANTNTVIYSVQMDDNPSFSSPTNLYPNVLTQTGADGAGAPAAEKRMALPSNVERYIRLRIVKSHAGDASGKNADFYLAF